MCVCVYIHNQTLNSIFSYIKAICCTTPLPTNPPTTIDMRLTQLIPPVHTHGHTIAKVSWDQGGERCVRATYWFHSSLQGCCFVPLPLKTLNLICSAYRWCNFPHGITQTPPLLHSKAICQPWEIKVFDKLKVTLGKRAWKKLDTEYISRVCVQYTASRYNKRECYCISGEGSCSSYRIHKQTATFSQATRPPSLQSLKEPKKDRTSF